jgi:competence protein ComEC
MWIWLEGRNGHYRLSRTVGLVCIALLAAGSIWVWTLVLAEPRGLLTFAALDVGQGDSLYIEGPTGVQVLIDGGPDNSLLAELPKVMSPFDRSLNAVIETHPDADHINGLVDVLLRYEVGAFVEPGILKYDEMWSSLEHNVTIQRIPRYIARRGMVLDLGGGAELQILYPNWDPTHMSPRADNNGGIVTRLVYGNTSVLLMADVDGVVEERLLTLEGSALKSTVLKVAHHGSKYSSDAEFLDVVDPEIAVISVGEHNRYGHPTPEVLDRLEAEDVSVYRTDEEGTLVFRSDGTHFWQVK